MRGTAKLYFMCGKIAALPDGSAWTTDAEFDVISAHFQAPADDERFNVVRRERA